MAKITVITPSFNQGQYIEETILSVLNQNYPALEFIVVDACSNDATAQILERYRKQITHLIIEPDNGQTDAINKGLKLASGDLVTWLNSDDMYAPGALHALAQSWIATKADVLFGACLPHRNYRFELANMPAVRQATFTPDHLGQIFELWLKGHYFYQPEVIFTREILQKAGGLLDDKLHYTMDYELWMRFASLGAKIEPVFWPVALFRHHDEQKTKSISDCIIEQGVVRERYSPVVASRARQEQIRKSIVRAVKSNPLTLGIVSSRLGKIFSPASTADLRSELAALGIDVHLSANAHDLPDKTGMILKLVHLQSDMDDLAVARRRFPAAPVAGWFWDNHHNVFDNHDVAQELDVTIAGHEFASAYLRNQQALHIGFIPLCVTQWTKREATLHFEAHGRAERSNKLYGGFVRYAFAGKRNRLVEDVVAAGFDGVFLLDKANAGRYFSLSGEERFAEWCAHKTSICLPLNGDLSQRLFDALLTGQVPVVAPDIRDLDRVITPQMQQDLPFVIMRDYSVAAVREAHEKAVQLYDQGGLKGAVARHRYALDHHTMPARIAGIVQHLRRMG